MGWRSRSSGKAGDTAGLGGQAAKTGLSWVSDNESNEMRWGLVWNVPMENGSDNLWENGNQKNEKLKNAEIQPTPCHKKHQMKNQNTPASSPCSVHKNLQKGERQMALLIRLVTTLNMSQCKQTMMQRMFFLNYPMRKRALIRE